MADNFYTLETYSSVGIVQITDDGTGSDWITISGTYYGQPGSYGASIFMFYDDHSLAWYNTYANGQTTQHALVVFGVIENAVGGAGQEEIVGNTLANRIYGDPDDVAGGNDALYGRAGADTVTGGGGNDFIFGDEDNDLLFGDIDFSTGSSNFAAGDDAVFGGQGNDTMSAWYGANTLDGGDGYDTADYSTFFDDFGNTTYRIVANVWAGTVTVFARDTFDGSETIVATDTISQTEVILGTAGDDRIEAVHILVPGDPTGTAIYGGAGRDTLWGGPGLDALYGGDGDDALSDFSAPPPGGGGVDVMSGGFGNDYYTIFNATTAIVELFDHGFDYVVTAVSYTLPANVEKLTLAPFPGSPMDGTGNTQDNSLEGNAGANVLTCLAGNDYATGDAGNDALYGGGGADGLYGGTENDLIYGGGQDDQLFGDTGSDRLFGGSENDQLSGGAQADFLQGGLGRDQLRGGSGADTFYFASAADTGATRNQRDTIADFRSGQDTIDLHRIAKNQVFINAAAFSASGDAEVRYDRVTGLLSGDTDGNGTADYQIQLSTNPLLTAGDLIL